MIFDSGIKDKNLENFQVLTFFNFLNYCFVVDVEAAKVFFGTFLHQNLTFGLLSHQPDRNSKI